MSKKAEDLKDLLKLAEKNIEEACKKFSEIYGADQVSYFANFHYSDQKLGYKINPNRKHITIENIDLMKKFLRHFGHLMSKEVKVVSDDDPSFKWDDMIKLIYSHCNAVKKLHLFNDISTDDPVELVMRKITRVKEMSRNPLRLTEPFASIECLKIENIYLDTQLKIDGLCPKIRSLDLLGVVASDPSLIEVSIPRMEHFGIAIEKEYEVSSDEDGGLDVINEDDENETAEKSDGNDDKRQFNWTNIKSVLVLNPQLQSVYLDMEINISMVEFINETLPNLQKIQISFSENDFDDHNLNNDIVFKNITSASLGHLGRIMPPLTFEKLENLDFITSAYQSTIDFIKKHQHLKSLDLNCEYSDIQGLRIIKSLPDLKDLYMIIENQVKWSARGLIRFLAECERLETLMLMLEVDSEDQRNWRSLVANVWQIEEGYNKDLYTIEKTEVIDSYNKSIKSIFSAKKP